jgi:tetratricopeptide (TPR) repeat protein
MIRLLVAMLIATPVFAAPYSDSEISAIIKPEEARVRDIRRQEIQQLQLALSRRLPQNRRADLYFRLAELYLEGYRQEFLLEGRAHERRIERGGSGTLDRTRSKPYLRLGVQACEQIVKIGLSFPKMDQVYYFLGVNLGELGEKRRSNQAFLQLVRRYPQSAFSGEAYRELGEDAFDQKKYRDAVGYFQQAAARTRGDNLPRILHRLAWSYYRTKQYDRAVSTMKEAISQLAKGGEQLLSLREEALRDIAVFFTESGRVNEALAYFEEVAGDKDFYAKALEKLGKQYERSKDPKRAGQVYETILKTRPEDEAAFRVLAKLIDTDLKRQKFADAANRLRGPVAVLPMGDDETGIVARNLRAQVRRTATESHEKYRKKGDRDALAVAETFYKAYLDKFVALEDPRNEKPEIQMYLADVLRERGKSAEAAATYKAVIQSDDDRYAKQAAQLWTASLSDSIQKASKQPGFRRGTEPSNLEKEFVEAADALQERLGEQTEGREAALRAAQVLADYPSTRKEAIERSGELMKRAPSTPQGLTAARLYLQIHVDLSKIKPEQGGIALGEVHEAVEEIGQVPGLIDYDRKNGGKLIAGMRGEETRIQVGRIAESERARKFDQAAQGYEEFARTQADAKLAEQAYANAVGAHIKSGDLESVERVVSEWLKRFPRSERSVESVRAAATAALIGGAFTQSARLFERLGRNGKDLASLETAARIYDGLGETKAARSAWERITKLYSKESSRFAAALSLADSFVDDPAPGSEKTQADFYRYCMNAGGALAAECGAKLGDLYTRLKDIERAQKQYQEVAKMGPRGKAAAKSSPYIGYARYRVAEILEQGRRFPPLSLPEAQLKKGLQARLEFLEPLSRAYASAVETGGPWAVAALNRLARFAERFAQEVDQIAPPEGSAAVQEQFRAGLRSVSGPLRAKAMETWKRAYDQASEQDILSPAIVEIGDRLAEGNDGRGAVPRSQGSRARFRLAGMPADGGDPGASTALEATRGKLTQNPRNASAWLDYGNLLWGQGKPGLAKIAYERSLALKPGDASALNNRAVVELGGSGQDEWVTANAAAGFLKQALERDDLFLAAKFNLASLLTYYRVFPKARKLWEQVLVKAPSADAQDGLAASLAGLGNQGAVEQALDRAEAAGASKSRFVRVYLDASREKGGKCLDRLDDVDRERLAGFERIALENLRAYCSRS